MKAMNKKAIYVKPYSKIMMFNNLLDENVPGAHSENHTIDAKGYSFDDYDEEEPFEDSFAPTSVGDDALKNWKKNVWED